MNSSKGYRRSKGYSKKSHRITCSPHLLDALFMQLISWSFLSFLSFWKQQSSTENSLGVPVPRSGFPGPKHGGSEARSNRRCEKISFQQKCRVSNYNKQNRIEHSAKISWGKHQAYQFLCQANSLWFLLLSSLLKKQASQRLHAEKGLTPRLVSVDTSPSCLERLGHRRDWNSFQDSTDIPFGM